MAWVLQSCDQRKTLGVMVLFFHGKNEPSDFALICMYLFPGGPRIFGGVEKHDSSHKVSSHMVSHRSVYTSQTLPEQKENLPKWAAHTPEMLTMLGIDGGDFCLEDLVPCNLRLPAMDQSLSRI